ncbi:hypothetical protein ASPZODRAFT_167436 [Penicilliopsis zonata CBS 506.65]|uniref:Uncharacterized protein n=1 Tax=Penicilliopsis zonata CBS 506.65 TaxID=1073090 RepID=A0A1L9SET9_9EURO|nr:hypothetical protein ASPZODRAFT_167436 [Penicilliopsis zonata CBS 506.65]OJJ45689.1 hypothetical protein ASPZODRAFT_167436 [Penicilliopsis zonata CBS 506.65]
MMILTCLETQTSTKKMDANATMSNPLAALEVTIGNLRVNILVILSALLGFSIAFCAFINRWKLCVGARYPKFPGWPSCFGEGESQEGVLAAWRGDEEEECLASATKTVLPTAPPNTPES